MLLDLHSHTLFSDGTLSVEDMVAAAERRGYDAFAITDHARNGDPNFRDIVVAVRSAVERLASQTPVQLLAGVELTDFEPERIPGMVQAVRHAGAQIVVVHGECLTRSVAPGTNAAAVRCCGVDILAHPGLVSREDAVAASQYNVCLELSARNGASYANGHVYQMARNTGASIVVNSDAHSESGLLSRPKVAALIRGAGAPESYLRTYPNHMLPGLMRRINRRTSRAIL